MTFYYLKKMIDLKIREFSYRFEDDAYLAPDMTLLAEHITGNGIVDVDYAQEPESIYWAVRERIGDWRAGQRAREI